MSEYKTERPLGASCSNKAKKLMPDYKIWGDSDVFKLISKFSSEKAGIMKSTKAMQCGDSVVVQVTTQQRNPDGTYAIAEALTTVDNAYIYEDMDDNGIVFKRQIINLKSIT